MAVAVLQLSVRAALFVAVARLCRFSLEASQESAYQNSGTSSVSGFLRMRIAQVPRSYTRFGSAPTYRLTA